MSTPRTHVRGRGPLVTFIPSLGRGAEDYGPLLDLVAGTGHRAMAVEPLPIDADAEGVTLRDLARDVAAAIESEAETQRAIVVGHGFGARVARVLATDRPDLVRAVVILAATARRAVDPDILASVRESSNLTLPDAERLVHLRRAFFAPGNNASVWLGGWDEALMNAQLAASARTPVESYIAAGTAPILLLQPAEDSVAPLEHAHLLADEFGDRVTMEVIPRAGHAAVPEQPQLIAEAIARYARGLRAPIGPR